MHLYLKFRGATDAKRLMQWDLCPPVSGLKSLLESETDSFLSAVLCTAQAFPLTAGVRCAQPTAFPA